MDADNSADPLYVPCSDSEEETAISTAANAVRQGQSTRGKGRSSRRTRRRSRSLSSTERSVSVTPDSPTFYTPGDPQLILQLYREVEQRGSLELECQCAGEELRRARRAAEEAAVKAAATSTTNDNVDSDGDDRGEETSKKRSRRRHVRGIFVAERPPQKAAISTEFEFEEDNPRQPVHRAHRGRRKAPKRHGDIGNVMSSLWRSGEMDPAMIEAETNNPPAKACVKTPMKLGLADYSFSQAMPSPDAKMDLSSQVAKIANCLDVSS